MDIIKADFHIKSTSTVNCLPAFFNLFKILKCVISTHLFLNMTAIVPAFPAMPIVQRIGGMISHSLAMAISYRCGGGLGLGTTTGR